MIRFFQSIRHNDNKLSFQTCMKNKTVNGQIWVEILSVQTKIESSGQLYSVMCNFKFIVPIIKKFTKITLLAVDLN